MRGRVGLLASLAVVSIAALVSVTSAIEPKPQQSRKVRDFVIAGSDGYGTQECLATKSSCGRIVANAWCEAKGLKAAQAWRQLGPDEITGSTNTSRNAKPVESFLITCRE
jgi:hypothetical protein